MTNRYNFNYCLVAIANGNYNGQKKYFIHPKNIFMFINI